MEFIKVFLVANNLIYFSGWFTYVLSLLILDLHLDSPGQPRREKFIWHVILQYVGVDPFGASKIFPSRRVLCYKDRLKST